MQNSLTYIPHAPIITDGTAAVKFFLELFLTSTYMVDWQPKGNDGMCSASWYLGRDRFRLVASVPRHYEATVKAPEVLRGWHFLLNGTEAVYGEMTFTGMRGPIELIGERTTRIEKS